MGITVADLLKLNIYRENAQAVVSEGLKNEVQYFTVMEAPDFHFDSLTAHVFILTTLSAHHDSLEEVNRIIRGLCETNVAAIGIKLGRFINEIDPSTIEIVQEYHVPLITFSQNVFFREILSSSLALISDTQRVIIDQINIMNRELFDAILHHCSWKQLIKLLCDKIECYGCCMDAMGTRIAEASSLTVDLDVNAVRAAMDRFFVQQEEVTRQNYMQCGNIIIFPCRAKQEFLGVLCIVVEDNRTELVLPLAEAIANALSVKFLEHNLKVQTEREMVASILDDVLFSEHKDENVIIDRLTLLNFEPQEHHVLVVIKGRDNDFSERNSSRTLDVIQNLFQQRFESTVVFVRGSRYIALLSYKNEKKAATMSKIMEYCSTSIEKVTHQRLDIGCSMPVTDFREMPECYQQAKHALQYGRMVHPESRVYLYDDYFEMGLISYGLHTNAGDTFFKCIINPILEYDRKYKSELWPTLECCFFHSTLENVSAKLYIHISTLRYRLQKIQALTGYNYFDIKGRMSLYMAYLLYKVSQEQ